MPPTLSILNLMSAYTPFNPATAWETSLSLQNIYGYKPSSYLRELAARHVNGSLTLKDIDRLLQDKPSLTDAMTLRMTSILGSDSFALNKEHFQQINSRLLDPSSSNAGRFRTQPLSTKEWILQYNTITYTHPSLIESEIDALFLNEKATVYIPTEPKDAIRKLSDFASKLWQIQAFDEGNGRTLSLFFLQYLHHLGFHIDFRLFCKKALYFRNSLIRANYANQKLGVTATSEFLERFMQNLVLDASGTLTGNDVRLKLHF